MPIAPWTTSNRSWNYSEEFDLSKIDPCVNLFRSASNQMNIFHLYTHYCNTIIIIGKTNIIIPEQYKWRFIFYKITDNSALGVAKIGVKSNVFTAAQAISFTFLSYSQCLPFTVFSISFFYVTFCIQWWLVLISWLMPPRAQSKCRNVWKQ